MRDSVLGCGSYVGQGSRVEGAVLLGCQVYQGAAARAALVAAGQPTLGVGAWCCFDGGHRQLHHDVHPQVAM